MKREFVLFIGLILVLSLVGGVFGEEGVNCSDPKFYVVYEDNPPTALDRTIGFEVRDRLASQGLCSVELKDSELTNEMIEEKMAFFIYNAQVFVVDGVTELITDTVASNNVLLQLNELGYGVCNGRSLKSLSSEDLSSYFPCDLMNLGSNNPNKEDFVVSCTDSDHGINYDVDGLIYGINEEGKEYSFWDRCPDVGEPNYGILQEYSCTSKGISSTTGYDCAQEGKVCEGGKCVEEGDEGVSCIDSDNGLDYYNKGIMILGGSQHHDVCVDSNFLQENYCNLPENNYLDNYYCENGCQNGACIDNGDGSDYPSEELLMPEINDLIVSQNGVAFAVCGELDEVWCNKENPRAEGEGPFEFKWGDGEVSCSWFNAKHEYGEEGKYEIHVRVKNSCGFISDRNSFVKLGEDSESEVGENEEGEEGVIDVPEGVNEASCSGCLLDKKCYPFGYRKSGNYCSDSFDFIKQFGADESCENNFECSSNVCVSGECVSQGLMKKILSWFKNLFS